MSSKKILFITDSAICLKSTFFLDIKNNHKDNVVTHIKAKNVLQLPAYKLSKFLLKNYTKDIFVDSKTEIILIEKSKNQTFANFIKKHYCPKAKIVLLSFKPQTANHVDNILISNIYQNKIKPKYKDKIMFYKGAICATKFNHLENKDTLKNDVFIRSIQNKILTCFIGSADHEIDPIQNKIKSYCEDIISFANKHDIFVFVVLNIKNEHTTKIISSLFTNSTNCYICNIKSMKSFDKYNAFISASENIFHYRIDIKNISWLMTLEKKLSIYILEKDLYTHSVFLNDITQNCAQLYQKEISENNIKTIALSGDILDI